MIPSQPHPQQPPYPQQQAPYPGPPHHPGAPPRRRRWVVPTVVAVVLLLVAGGAGAWWLWGRDGGGAVQYHAGRAIPAPAPVEEEPEQAWEVEGGGTVIGSDADEVLVHDDGTVRALSMDDGEELWSADLPEGTQTVAPHADPDGFVLVDGQEMTVSWFSIAEREVTWTVDGLVTGTDEDVVYVRPGTPQGEGGDVAGLVAVGQDDGEVRWRAEAVGGATVGDDLVVVRSLDGEVVALDAADGEERWRVDRPQEGLFVAVADGVVVVAGADGVTAYAGEDGEEVFEEAGLERATVTRTAPDRVLVLADDTAVLLGEDGEVARTTLDSEVERQSGMAVFGGRVDGRWVVEVPQGRAGSVVLDEDLEEVAPGPVRFVADGFYAYDEGDVSFHDDLGGEPEWTVESPGGTVPVEGGLLTYPEDGRLVLLR
ncbi:PQQ-binding-like beta-propeller repeat protein [Nocardioides sp. CPCC 205120]|uniref:outer membrane protein assembly factor BamB family protein n=1 Tax=Nocardioides sp. CPCC 205120 TaxID=3406462 RepID=UPI003B50CE64